MEQNILRKWPLCAGRQACWKEGAAPYVPKWRSNWLCLKRREMCESPGGKKKRKEWGENNPPPSFPHHLQQSKVLKKHLWFEWWEIQSFPSSSSHHRLPHRPPSNPTAAASLAGLGHNLFPRQKKEKNEKKRCWHVIKQDWFCLGLRLAVVAAGAWLVSCFWVAEC